MEQVLYGVRLLHYAAAMAAFGGSLFRQIAGLGAIDRALRPAIVAAALLSLLSAVLWLLLEAGSMAGDPAACVDPATVSLVLTATEFGHLWSVRLILGLGLVVASLGRRWGPITLLASLSLASLAGEGHGGIGAGVIGRSHLASQTIHLLAAGAWLGGLLPLALLLRDRAVGATEARVAVARFSTLGYIAVSLVLATGTVNTAVLSGGDFRSASAWAAALGIKLGLVAAMLALAVTNRTSILSGWDTGLAEARRQLYRRVLVEAVLAVLVLAAASILGTLPPPRS